MKQKTLFLAALVFASVSVGENWPSWRGENENGATKSKAPSSFSLDHNLDWKVELPGRGCSTPIAWGKQIFVTSEIGQEDGVLAYDWSGKELWRASLGPLRAGRSKRVGSGANSSPVTDGKYVFTYFKSGNVAALSTSGKLIWKTNLIERYGEDKLWWDQGTSPVLAGGNVVVAIMQTEGNSYLVSLDRKTGKEVWKTSREYDTGPETGDSYTTPHVLTIDGIETIVTWGANHLTGHNAETGKLIWEIDGFNPNDEKLWRVIASAVIEDGIAVVPYGRGNFMGGVRLGAKQGMDPWLWSRENLGTDSVSPVISDGKVYVLKDSGIGRGRVSCLDAETGKTLWESALPKSANIFYASLLMAGDTLYATREDGVVFAAKITSTGLSDIVENQLQEGIIASPIAVNNKLLLRGDEHLFCFAN